MKKLLRLAAITLALLAVCASMIACQNQKTDAALTGQWRITSYITLDGVNASIENDMDMVFFGNGYGQTLLLGENINSFQYMARRGTMTRSIDKGNGELEVVEERYELSEDGQTLTIHTPKTDSTPGATIVLQKIEQ